MRQFDLIPGFVQIFMGIVRADGEIHPDELNVVRRFFESNFDYGPHEMASVEREIEFCCQSDSSASVDYLPPLLVLPEVLRELVVDCAVDIALADQVLEKSETKALLGLAQALVLPSEYIESLESQLDLWATGTFSDVERSYQKLGLPFGSSLSEINRRFAHLRLQYQNEHLPSLGVEYAILAKRRLAELTAHYERLATSLDKVSQPSTEELDPPTLEELGLIASTVDKLSKLSITRSCQLEGPGAIRSLLSQGLTVEELGTVGQLRSPKGRGKSAYADTLRSSIRMAVDHFLTEHIEFCLDAEKIPVKVDSLLASLRRRLKGVTQKLLESALAYGERQGLFFDCGQNKWILVKFLQLPSATVQELWRLALVAIATRTSVNVHELVWRHDFANLPTVRVDYALKTCPGLHRQKPGVYIQASLPSASNTKKSAGASGLDGGKEEKDPGNYPVAHLGLQTGTKNALLRAGLPTIGQVLKLGAKQLCTKTRGFGPVAWKDLEKALRAFGRDRGLLSQFEPFFLEGAATLEFGGSSRKLEDSEISKAAEEADRLDAIALLQQSLAESDYACLRTIYYRSGSGPWSAPSAGLALSGDQVCSLLRINSSLLRFSERLRLYCDGLGGWAKSELLADFGPFRNIDTQEMSFVLRVVSAAFEDFAFIEFMNVFTAREKRFKLLLDQKHRAVKELGSPRALDEVVDWLSEQFVDLPRDQARVVVFEAWRATVLAATRSRPAILVAYGEPNEVDELACLLLGEHGGLTVEELVGLHSDMESRFPLYASEIEAILQAYPEVFVQTSPERYSLWSNIGFRQDSWMEPVMQLVVVLWSAGRATNERWILGFFHRHGHTQPWLNEFTVSTLLDRFPEAFDRLAGGNVRPKGSDYKATPLSQLLLETLAEHSTPITLEQIEAGVRQVAWYSRQDLESALAQACSSRKIVQSGECWSLMLQGSSVAG